MQNEKKNSNLLPKRISYYGTTLLLLLALSYSFEIKAQEILSKKITLPRQRTTIYSALNQISDSIGYFFAYSSKDISSDKVIRVNVFELPVKQAIFEIIGDTTLQLKVIDQHILIQKAPAIVTDPAPKRKEEIPKRITISGRILDSKTLRPVPFATVGIPALGLGNVSNQDGVFLLRIPNDINIQHITISHVGYKPKKLPLSLFSNKPIDVFIETDYISIQEVFIRNIEPSLLVKEALSRIYQNYSNLPVSLTTFYREGIIKNDKYQNYSEAVFSVYKSPYTRPNESDQVKLLKSRKIQNIEQSDTLSIKLRGGLNSSLSLDIIKNLPDFFMEETIDDYVFSRKDIITIGSRTAYAIAFEQKAHLNYPLFKGLIYVDMENLAILGADFEVNPKYISSTSSRYVHKRNRKFIIKAEKIEYAVRYQSINGINHLSHVRGDLRFKYRKRRSISSNTFHAFLELATTQIDTLNVKRFSRSETEKTTSVFADAIHEYDEEFWNDFNIISPEQSVFENLPLIKSKIESIYRVD